MIYTVSKRCDVVGLYWDWFLDKVTQGKVAARNPLYPWKVSEYNLDDTCEGFRFITRDARPAVKSKAATQLLVDTYANTWEIGLCGYRVESEPWVRKSERPELIEAIQQLSEIAGKRRITWVYGPVFFWNGRYDADFHVEAFNHLYDQLKDYVDTIRIDFLTVTKEIHDKAKVLRESNFFERADFFAGISHDDKICVSACSGDMSRFNLSSKACCDLASFGEANGLVMKNLKCHGADDTAVLCHCIDSRDIASVGTCPRDCIWCTRTSNLTVANNYNANQRVNSLILGEPIKPTDSVSTSAKQRMYVKGKVENNG